MVKKSRVKANPSNEAFTKQLTRLGSMYESPKAFLEELAKYYTPKISITPGKNTTWNKVQKEGSFLYCIKVLAYGGTCRDMVYVKNQALKRALFVMFKNTNKADGAVEVEVNSDEVGKMIAVNNNPDTRPLTFVQKLALNITDADAVDILDVERAERNRKAFTRYFEITHFKQPQAMDAMELGDLQDLVAKAQAQATGVQLHRIAVDISGGSSGTEYVSDSIIRALHDRTKKLDTELGHRVTDRKQLYEVGGVDEENTSQRSGLSSSQKVGVATTIGGAVIGGALNVGLYKEHRDIRKEISDLETRNEKQIDDIEDIPSEEEKELEMQPDVKGNNPSAGIAAKEVENNGLKNDAKPTADGKCEAIINKIRNAPDVNNMKIKIDQKITEILDTNLDTNLDKASEDNNLQTRQFKRYCIEDYISDLMEKNQAEASLFSQKVIQIYKLKISKALMTKEKYSKVLKLCIKILRLKHISSKKTEKEWATTIWAFLTNKEIIFEIATDKYIEIINDEFPCVT